MIDGDDLIQAKQGLTDLNGILSRRDLIDVIEELHREDIIQELVIQLTEDTRAGLRQPEHVDGTYFIFVLVEMSGQRAEISDLFGHVIHSEETSKERGNQSQRGRWSVDQRRTHCIE